jgi:hypothetical protein
VYASTFMNITFGVSPPHVHTSTLAYEHEPSSLSAPRLLRMTKPECPVTLEVSIHSC